MICRRHSSKQITAQDTPTPPPRTHLLAADQTPGNPIHLSTVVGTNGGYSAWSKFNRHPWSEFNRRRHRNGKHKGRDSRHALCGLLLRSGRDNPQTSGLRWSPPVRIRHTRTKWRAQQRMSWVTTGSSCLGLENLPRPARGSESSWRPSRVKVKRFLHPSQNCTGPQFTECTRCTAARLRLSRTCYRVKVTGPDAR